MPIREFDSFYQQFSKHINKIWICKIINEFETCNKEIETILYKKLQKPNFSLTMRSSKIWGTWEQETRTISININLLRYAPWESVIYVLKHEIAHMIVEEIFRKHHHIKPDGAHGELFKKACTVLGINKNSSEMTFPYPTVSYKYTGKEFIITGYEINENERTIKSGSVVHKVRKLMALAESPSKNEAETAIAKAYKLIAKYNLSQMELKPEARNFISRPVGRQWKKTPVYVTTLASILNKYYFVYPIFCYGDIGKYLEIFGEPANVDIAEYVFHFLLCEGEYLWKKQKTREKSLPPFLRSRKNAFIDGLYKGFEVSLKKSRKYCEPENKINDNREKMLPITTDDKLLRRKYEEKYPRRSSVRYKIPSHESSIRIGFNLGKKIRLRQAITKKDTSGIKKLLSGS